MFVIKYSKRLLVLGLLMLIFIASATALAAANTVPVTAMEDYRATVNFGSIVPDCSGITFASKDQLLMGPFPGNIANGGNGDDCIIGTAANESLSGGQGNDVILGGAGNDHLYGGQGNDYLDGGPGIDICEGGQGNGTDTFVNCETIIR
jgi:hypothetical protein